MKNDKKNTVKGNGDTGKNYDIENIKILERRVNSNVIKYVFKEIMTNLSVKVPDEKKIQEAADIILDIADFVEEVSIIFFNTESILHKDFEMMTC